MTIAIPKAAALAAVGCALLAGVVPAAAHHSYAMFDKTKKLTVTGTVTNFEWAAPHIYAWVSAPNDKGGTDLWGFEGASPTALAHFGWTRNSLKVGDKITVDMRPLKDGRNGGYLVKVIKADGSELGDSSTLKE